MKDWPHTKSINNDYVVESGNTPNRLFTESPSIALMISWSCMGKLPRARDASTYSVEIGP